MTKVGIVGCPKTTVFCREIGDLPAARKGAGIFKEIGPAEVIGCVACDGCPGKKLVDRAAALSRCGADIIAFSSDLNEFCPHRASLLSRLNERLKTVIVIAGLGKEA